MAFNNWTFLLEIDSADLLVIYNTEIFNGKNQPSNDRPTFSPCFFLQNFTTSCSIDIPMMLLIFMAERSVYFRRVQDYGGLQSDISIQESRITLI